MRDLTPEELQEILAEHEKWLDSDGEEGKQAKLVGVDLEQANLEGARLEEAILVKSNLRGANLKRVNLSKAQLERANLSKANLFVANLAGAILPLANLKGADLLAANLNEANMVGANLSDTNLLDTNLRGADLRGANLKLANLKDAILRETDLQDADLTDAKRFSIKQLAGARVRMIKLPTDDLKSSFDKGLDRVAEASKNARKIFQIMLLACLYVIITIGTTTDVNLLTNSTSSPLPFIGASIPTAWFYIVAPLLLLGCYLYFHIYLQRLWEELAFLPAIFPDGKRLDEKAYPWILNGLVSSHFKHLKDNKPEKPKEDRPHLAILQKVISIGLAWWSVPITFVLFWARYLPRHEWYGTGLHISLLSISIWASFNFYLLAKGKLKGEKNKAFRFRGAWKEKKPWLNFLAILAIGILFSLFSHIAINGLYPESFPFYSWIKDKTTANFYEEDVSIKPPSWTGKTDKEHKDEISLVKGAHLKECDLQRANAKKAFLVKADLRDADLRKANLMDADLRNANLEGADMRGADLRKADLMKANLRNANLRGADMIRADLRGADLRDVNLEKAKFGEGKTFRYYVLINELWKYQRMKSRGANLKGADLSNVRNFEKVENFNGAKLINVTGLTKEQKEFAKSKGAIIEEPKP